MPKPKPTPTPAPAHAIAPLNDHLALQLAALTKAVADPILDATGRPSKFTPDTITRIAAALRLGHTVTDACTYAGVRPDLYRSWLRRGQNGEAPYDLFVEVIERLNIDAYSPAVACLTNASTHNWKAAERLLSRRAPSQWGTGQEQSGGGITVMFGLELRGSAA